MNDVQIVRAITSRVIRGSLLSGTDTVNFLTHYISTKHRWCRSLEIPNILLRQTRVRLPAEDKGREVRLKKEGCRGYGYNRFNPKLSGIGTNKDGTQNCLYQDSRPFSSWSYLLLNTVPYTTIVRQVTSSWVHFLWSFQECGIILYTWLQYAKDT